MPDRCDCAGKSDSLHIGLDSASLSKDRIKNHQYSVQIGTTTCNNRNNYSTRQYRVAASFLRRKSIAFPINCGKTISDFGLPPKLRLPPMDYIVRKPESNYLEAAP